MVSLSRHSRYWRKLSDLPLQGTSVTLKLQLGRWRCRSQECVRQIFTERLVGVLVPHARQTNRLREIQMLMGRALGGRPGQRMLSRLGMSASRHTVLRQVTRAARGSPLKVIRVLGVGDWAWSKGQSFGTILVDLERSEVVDLLPTRSADSLSEWLVQHPEVVVVSRDRHGIYAEGARRGAPDAVQVADRFHLILNLSQAVERELAVQRQHLCVSAPCTPALPSAQGKKITKPQGRQIQVRSSIWRQQAEIVRQRRQQKLDLFQTIQANEMRWPEGDADRSTDGHQPTAHR